VYLIGGAALLALADTLYAIHFDEGGDAVQASVVLWPLSVLMLAAAAWQRPSHAARRSPARVWQVVTVPLGATIAMVPLVLVEVPGESLQTTVNVLRAGVFLLVGLRFTLSLLQNSRLLDRARHEALHDPLTRLPNRRLFLDRIDHELRSAGRHRACVAVLFVDLDGFKLLNDSLGHAAGDAVVRETGARLHECLRPSDTVARLGSDEFTVLCRVQEATDASFVAERIAGAISAPMQLSDHTSYLSASIGIALTRDPSYGAERLLREADMAMYRAKSQGTGIELFSAEIGESSRKRLRLSTDLRRALERQALDLAFQPIFHVPTGRITEVEALLRWNHPQLGPVSPAEFVPLAENIGVIGELGRFVLRAALGEAAAWPGDVAVAVNVSPRQLADPHLPDEIRLALDETGVAPSRLRLEITETAVMDDPVRSRELLDQLAGLGVPVAIDDFGAGYSSLTHLRSFRPLTELKIDKTFINDVATERGPARGAAHRRLRVRAGLPPRASSARRRAAPAFGGRGRRHRGMALRGPGRRGRDHGPRAGTSGNGSGSAVRDRPRRLLPNGLGDRPAWSKSARWMLVGAAKRDP
jgi:diguanylate cyclase (GGDEF)-like protein